MKWITKDEIKQNSRIDFDYDDDLVTRCGEAAEAVILKLTRRTYDNIEDLYGEKPKDLVEAALMLADVGYKHRSPVSDTNKSVIPYTFDFIIAPFTRADKANALQAERNDLLDILGGVHVDLTFNYSELENPTQEQTTGYNNLKQQIASVMTRFAQYTQPTSNVCKALRDKVKDIKQEADELFQ